MNPDGSGLQRITTGQAARMSPDGRKIVYEYQSSIYNGGSFVIRTAFVNGAGVTDLGSGMNPSWSPDGTKIAFSDGIAIDIMNADGSNKHAVLTGGGHIYDRPSWSPDGTQLAVTASGGSRYIAVVNSDGTGLHPVASATSWGNPINDYPIWSPDGQWIAYIPPSGGVAVVHPDGTGNMPLGGGTVYSVGWTPDSSRVMYTQQTIIQPSTVLWHILTVSPDGSGTRQLTSPIPEDVPIETVSGGFQATITDATPPLIQSALSAVPNAQGWNNTPVTLTWSTTDLESGVADRQGCDDTPINTETAGTTFTCTATSTGGTASQLVTVRADWTPPALAANSSPTWSQNPKSVNSTTTLTVPFTDNLSGIQKAEYFIGDTDPGQGNGATMTLTNVQNGGLSANVTTSFGTDFQPGVYKISVRAMDNAGNWSGVVSDYLVVFDPSGPTDVAASKSIVPNAGNGDVLPGMPDTKNNKAILGFDVYYTSTGNVDSNSQLTLDYATGSACKSPHPDNCHTTHFAVTTTAPNVVNWLSIAGQNNSIGTFIGQGTLTIDGVTTTSPFKVVATDGGRTTPMVNDDVVLYIFPSGTDPNNADPETAALYKLHVASGGNWVKVQ